MSSIETLAAALRAMLGAEHVVTDTPELEAAVADLFPFPRPAPAALVVRPGSTMEVSEIVRQACLAGLPVVARGAGLSYTRGLAAPSAAVVVDSSRLDRIEIHAEDMFAVVGSGVSWQRLAEALAPHGLRSQVPGPISGAVTTVGGAISQYVPGSMDGVIGVRVVLADGTVAVTGSGARAGALPFHRHAGPDLTGLFIGDCGVFGIKTEVVLRLVREQPAAFASFAYADPQVMVADIIELRAAGLVTRALVLDQSRGEDAGRLEAGEALRTAGAVAASAGSALGALREMASMVKGRFELAAAKWSLHLTAEAPTTQMAEQLMTLARERCSRSAREIEPTVPTALRARPYSIRGFVGVEGERWIPVHGMLAPSRAQAALADLEALFSRHRAAMQAVGIRQSYLMSAAGPYLTIEPMFFWPDELDPIHLKHLSARNRERFAGRPRNDSARALVGTLRAEARECFERHDAAHAQAGRFYRHAERLDAGSAALLTRLRDALDPDRRMNPGVLGLG